MLERMRIAARSTAMVTALAALLLCGCGQKGPLYLPDKSGAIITAPATAPPTVPPAQPQGTPAQPQASPAPEPQAAPAPPQASPAPPQGTAAPSRKDDRDSDSQTPQ
jgi:predicted small lipoprotein YifL